MSSHPDGAHIDIVVVASHTAHRVRFEEGPVENSTLCSMKNTC
ncbi:MAG TPA: hypothetical protein PJ989_00025 [Oligoflexia bacterium]|nr:hypothetical protein [Oligoflexia bacterium]